MRSGQQILREFLLGRPVLLIEDKNLASVLLAESREPLITQSRQPVFVRHNQRTDFTGVNSIHQGQKLFASEVHAPSDFFNKLDGSKPTGRTELFQRKPLILRLLTRQ